MGSHTEQCTACQGSGKVYVRADSSIKASCANCGGLGYTVVDHFDDERKMVPAPALPAELAEVVDRVESEANHGAQCGLISATHNFCIVSVEDARTLIRHIRAQKGPGLTGDHIHHTGEMVQKWHPITTAPKDGTHILAWDGSNTAHHFDNHPPTVVHWFEDGFYPSVSALGDQPSYPATVWTTLYEQPALDAFCAARSEHLNTKEAGTPCP